MLLIDEHGVKQGLFVYHQIAFDKARYVLKRVGMKEETPIVKLMTLTKPSPPPSSVQPGPSVPKPETVKKKELYLGAAIAEHDYQHKLAKLIEFLKKGYLVTLGIDAKKETSPSELKAFYDKVMKDVHGLYQEPCTPARITPRQILWLLKGMKQSTDR